LGTPANFNGFRVLAALLHGTLVVDVSQTVALNRGRHLYSAGRPSRWELAHILVYCASSIFHNSIGDDDDDDDYDDDGRQRSLATWESKDSSIPVFNNDGDSAVNEV